jgi:hypothetical protein
MQLHTLAGNFQIFLPFGKLEPFFQVGGLGYWVSAHFSIGARLLYRGAVARLRAPLDDLLHRREAALRSLTAPHGLS